MTILELSFVDREETPRVVSITEMVEAYGRLHRQQQPGPAVLLRQALPTASAAVFEIYVENSVSLPCLLPHDWRQEFFNSSPPHIVAVRCSADQVLQNFGVRMGRRQQNQIALLIASLRQDLWGFEGAEAPMMDENGLPITRIYRRAMSHRL